jgi:hypothetical protein
MHYAVQQSQLLQERISRYAHLSGDAPFRQAMIEAAKNITAAIDISELLLLALSHSKDNPLSPRLHAQ